MIANTWGDNGIVLQGKLFGIYLYENKKGITEG